MTEPRAWDFFRRLRSDPAKAEDDVARFYAAAGKARLISEGDWLTIRDLTELSKLDQPAVHALLICLFSRLDEGSLCLRLDPPDRLRAALADFAPKQAAELERDIRRGVEDWRDLVGDEKDDYKPLILARASGRRLVYFQRCYEYERRLKQRLRQFAAGRDQGEAAGVEQALREVLEARPVFLDEARRRPLELADEQRQAVRLALTRNFVLISGGPGTGKTSIVLCLLRAWARKEGNRFSPERVRLAAPTGRAAWRMTETLRAGLGSLPHPEPADRALLAVEARTLHHLLGYRPGDHDYDFNASNPLPAGLVVVDEVSMADAGMLARLLEAVPLEAKLALLGDKDQLPSVEAGAVLSDLLPRQEPPGLAGWVVILSRSFRSERSLVELAGVVKSEAKSAEEKARVLCAPSSRLPPDVEWPVPERLPGGTVSVPGGGHRWLDLEQLSGARWVRVLESWAGRQFLERNPLRAQPSTYRDWVRAAARDLDWDKPDSPAAKKVLRELFERLRQSQILTLVRAGPHGAAGVNRRLIEFLGAEFEGAPTGAPSGLPMMVTRNHYELNLFNGDLGILLRDRRRRLRVVFPRVQLGTDGRAETCYAAFAPDLLLDREPAFAITVHKSQGSEYEQVLLVLPPEEPGGGETETEDLPAGRLLTREILYTGLTRAKYLAVLCGTRKVIRAALERKIERESGLAEWYETEPGGEAGRRAGGASSLPARK